MRKYKNKYMAIGFVICLLVTSALYVAGRHEVAQARGVPPQDESIEYMAASLANIALLEQDIANGIWKINLGGIIYFEGATKDVHEHSITTVDPLADVIYSMPSGDAGTGYFLISTLATNNQNIANSVWAESNKFIFEGASKNNFELILTPTEPTKDNTVTFANSGGVPVLSSLSGNSAEKANSVSFASNAMVFEGTKDAFENILTAADATADVLYTLPDAAAGTYGFIPSALVTNAVAEDNSVWGVSNGFAFGGATGDVHELTLSVMDDPVASIAMKLPSLVASAAMISALVTNDINVANSIWGVSNGLALGGATGANGFELTITTADPSQDNTATFPDLATQHVVIGGKIDHTGVIVTSTTEADGSTFDYTLPDAGGAIEVICGGTSSGTSDTQILRLLGGATIVSTITAVAADTGDWFAKFVVSNSSATLVSATGILNFATMPQGLADYQGDTTLDVSAVTTWTVELDLNAANDDFAVEFCVWKVIF